MIVCGMEMAASETRLVLLSENKSDFCHIDVKPRKIKIADDENAEEVRAFRDSLFAFFRVKNVDMVAVTNEISGTKRITKQHCAVGN